ncbi:MAG: hypothetical protein AAEJ52_06015 [Myxococcota bacterium]
MTEAQSRFLASAIRRKDLFLQLSILGVIVAVGLAGWYIWRGLEEPGASGGTGWVLVVLVLLNARQNLRQHKYAVLLEEYSERDTRGLGSRT